MSTNKQRKRKMPLITCAALVCAALGLISVIGFVLSLQARLERELARARAMCEAGLAALDSRACMWQQIGEIVADFAPDDEGEVPYE